MVDEGFTWPAKSRSWNQLCSAEVINYITWRRLLLKPILIPANNTAMSYYRNETVERIHLSAGESVFEFRVIGFVCRAAHHPECVRIWYCVGLLVKASSTAISCSICLPLTTANHSTHSAADPTSSIQTRFFSSRQGFLILQCAIRSAHSNEDIYFCKKKNNIRTIPTRTLSLKRDFHSTS